MNQITIDEEKCVGCALCVDDCPNTCLQLAEGKARFGKPACIACGHCYAICPQGAIRMSDYPCEDEPVVPMTVLDSGTLLSALRSRRTVRRFTPQPVEEEKVQKILEAGRYCPTGGNFQGVSYTILGSRQAEAEALCIDIFRNGDKLGAGPAAFLKQIDVKITDGFFFKGAPLVIAVTGMDEVNPALASSYMEIMAESLGLGVLYSGFFCECARISEGLRELLELPKGHKVVTCMVMGYPAVQYRRIAPRRALKAKTL